jgi:hypothetical protein
MSTPHKATKRQWENIALRAKANEEEGELACAFSTDSVLCEIADRVAALEEDDHKQRLVALHHEQRLAVLEAAATQPPAPAADHSRGATEMVATDEDLRKYWNKMRNSAMFDDAVRAVYNLGRQHSAQSRREREMVPREMVPVLRVLVKPGPGCNASVLAWIPSVGDLPIGEHILYAFPGASQPRQEVEAAPSPVTTNQAAIDRFAEWLAREMPPGTVIGDPLHWAPRIVFAVLNACQKVEPTQPPAPAGGLLEEVARLLVNRISAMPPGADCTPLARTVLCVVADAAENMAPDPNLTWERVAIWLDMHEIQAGGPE